MNNEEIKQATEQIVTEMLTESTGKAFGDSGDAYGRHWERNQKEIMKGKQPIYSYRNNETKTADIQVTIPIFDYLTNYMQYTEDCKMLEKALPHLHYDVLHYMEEFIGRIANPNSKLALFETNTLWGSKVGNTYNGEDSLSQGFQYIWFEYKGEDYIAISIHNGCDTRGGYTDIHIFKVDWSEEVWFAKSEAHIYCKCGMHKYYQQDASYIEYANIDEEVNEMFTYIHSYKDEDHNLRCKYCNEVIMGELRDI